VTVYSFDDFRKVLKRSGFSLLRRKKHETWQKVLSDGSILQVRISFKFHQDIYPALFAKMLKQAGLSKEEFERFLKE